MKASLFVALVALLPFALAAPAQSEEMVRTPGGLRSKSSVIQIPEGGSINLTDTEIHLLDASKKIIHVSPRSKAKVVPPAIKRATPPEQTGWISWAYWRRTSSPIQNFLTTWVVPTNPTTNNGQLVYLFNALVPDDSASIFQPVLQWGFSPAGGGPYWGVATWYVSNTAVYFTALQNVTVGQVLQGVIERTSQNADGTFNYASGFANIPGTATLSNTPELTYAYETLEAYGVTTGTDYPKGCTVYSAIDITTSSGTPSVSWNTVNDTADGITTVVNINSGNNGKISICYPS